MIIKGEIVWALAFKVTISDYFGQKFTPEVSWARFSLYLCPKIRILMLKSSINLSLSAYLIELAEESDFLIILIPAKLAAFDS